MIRASFESDYNNGCLPEILHRLSETNDEKASGYGFDPYTERAKDRIRKACDMTEAEVHFLVGGTQTNATAIDSLLLAARVCFRSIRGTSTSMNQGP